MDWKENINKVGSKAYNENIKTGESTYDAATVMPMTRTDDSLAAYASNNWEISDKLIFSQGIPLQLCFGSKHPIL
jgi:hypothetical protein